MIAPFGTTLGTHPEGQGVLTLLLTGSSNRVAHLVSLPRRYSGFRDKSHGNYPYRRSGKMFFGDRTPTRTVDPTESRAYELGVHRLESLGTSHHRTMDDVAKARLTHNLVVSSAFAKPPCLRLKTHYDRKPKSDMLSQGQCAAKTPKDPKIIRERTAWTCASTSLNARSNTARLFNQ